jgi:hypothetical protein
MEEHKRTELKRKKKEKIGVLFISTFVIFEQKIIKISVKI